MQWARWEVFPVTLQVEVHVRLKPGVLDAEGKNVQKSLELLGIPVDSVATTKVYRLTLERGSEAEAVAAAEESCRRLLANPVVHDYGILVVRDGASGTGDGER